MDEYKEDWLGTYIHDSLSCEGHNFLSQPLGRDLTVAFLDLNADKGPARVDTRNARGAAAHTVVQHGVTRIGVSPDEVLHERNGLLCWVDGPPATLS